MIFNALERGPEVDTSDQTLSSDAWLTFSGSNKPYVPEAWRRHKSRSEMRLLREISREISTSYFYYHIFFSLSLSDLLDFRIFFFFLPSLSFDCSSFSHRFRWDTSTSLTRLSTRAFWFQVIDILLSGGSELLVTTVPGDAVSRLADGIGSFGRLAGGYQKSGHLSILRRLPDPHLQSVHGLRGKRNEWRMKFTVVCTNWRRGLTWREICIPAWKIELMNSATSWFYIIFFLEVSFPYSFANYSLLWNLCKFIFLSSLFLGN